MLPQNITGVLRSDGQELFAAEGDQVASAHLRESLDVHAAQRELLLRPIQPVNDVLFSPLTRIWNQNTNTRVNAKRTT